MADDRWLRATVRSRWQDASAGGGPAYAVSWRSNHQWLLNVSQPKTRVVLTLTLPTPTLGGPPAHAPGLCLLRGNASPADQKRRKLVLAEGDLLASADPHRQTGAAWPSWRLCCHRCAPRCTAGSSEWVWKARGPRLTPHPHPPSPC